MGSKFSGMDAKSYRTNQTLLKSLKKRLAEIAPSGNVINFEHFQEIENLRMGIQSLTDYFEVYDIINKDSSTNIIRFPTGG